MSGFLRFLGIVNAAVWLGSGVFFAFFILPGVFSQNMHAALQFPPSSPFYAYYPGAIAQVLFKRFFILQYICGSLAILHFFAEKLYLGRKLPKLGLGIVIGIFALSIMGGMKQSDLEPLHKNMHFAPTQEQRDLARGEFRRWHGISSFVNLVIMGCLVSHLVRVSRQDESSRYITFSKFWG